MERSAATFQENFVLGWRVAVVEETGSTNSDLLQWASEGLPGRSVLVARHQTAGRGRLDRRWEAPAGANLLVSLLFRAPTGDTDRETPQQLVHRVALAVLAACAEVTGVRADLKWPNDVLLGDAKLAGILAEGRHVRGPSGEEHAVVVGVGLNVGWAPEGAARLGEGIDPLVVLAAVLRSIDAQPADVWPVYREHLATLGRRVRIDLEEGSFEGVAVDVERDGRLRVRTDDAEDRWVTAGDVVHLRPAE